ncbi:hypothetical protein [Pseudomonas protegens]|uniref:hypothetical protein n=1 Tax=Pseudomonas protegens TaxID=380021 RepID=UPI0021601817|nr:hypothetical protein [Pseudomonas protegens]UVL70758.1 hypothetical protein LOY23_22315 [Pseudomonas protegens]
MPICANGECAVLDQDGKVLVSADNDYDAVVALPLDKTFLFAKDGTWNLSSADGKQTLKAAFTDDLRLLTPGYFGFGQDGKLGIIDQSGKTDSATALRRSVRGRQRRLHRLRDRRQARHSQCQGRGGDRSPV